MNKNRILANRESSEWVVGQGVFDYGLLDVLEFMKVDLVHLLEEEGRFRGVVKCFAHSMDEAYEKIWNDPELTDDNSLEIYGRILYLFKPTLLQEHKRLKQKRLSPADSLIVIIHKMLDIIVQTPENGKGLRTLKKVIGKLFDNIKNNSKNDPLFRFSETIRIYKDCGVIGKHRLDRIDFCRAEPEKEVMQVKSMTKLEQCQGKIMEIDL